MDFNGRIIPSFVRYPILVVGFLALVLAILGGVRRIGFQVGWVPGHLSFNHGGLMVSSFLGTVIAMERAVAIDLPGTLAVPSLTAIGTLFIIVNVEPGLGILLIAISSVGLLSLFVYIFFVQPSLHNLILIAGAICWIVGNTLWWTHVPIYSLVAWWMGFLVFVIVAERLELNRIVQFSFFQKGELVSGVLLSLAGMGLQSALPFGSRIMGIGFIVMAIWLIRNDMVRRTLFMGGERAYTGWCLFTGYFWLALGGFILLSFPHVRAGFLYDAFLHCVFIGFVFTMIFGHAFIIMPGVMDLDLSYHAGFYLPLVLLEGTLLLRIVGDLTYSGPLRTWSGLGNGLVIVLFLVMLVETEIRGHLQRSDQ